MISPIVCVMAPSLGRDDRCVPHVRCGCSVVGYRIVPHGVECVQHDDPDDVEQCVQHDVVSVQHDPHGVDNELLRN